MRYIDVLPDFAYAYNHTVRCSIKIKTALVNKENEDRVCIYTIPMK